MNPKLPTTPMKQPGSLLFSEEDMDRYLLEDPTLDRAEFELRMLEEPARALAVADRMEWLQLVSCAAKRSGQRMVPRGEGRVRLKQYSRGRVFASARGKLWGVAVVAAVALLLMLGRSLDWTAGIGENWNRVVANGAPRSLEAALTDEGGEWYPLELVADSWSSLDAELSVDEQVEIEFRPESDATDASERGGEMLAGPMSEAQGEETQDWVVEAARLMWMEGES